MASIKQSINRLNSVKGKLPNVAKKSIKKNEKLILKLIKEEQLGKGFDSFGQDLVHPLAPGQQGIPNYEESTEFFWAKKPPKPRKPKKTGQRYNFEWTGTTYDTMKVKSETEGFDVTASRQRALEAIYGTKLMKLTPENMEYIEENVIEPALYEEIFATLNSFI